MSARMGPGVVGHVVPVAHQGAVSLVQVGPADHSVQNLHRPYTRDLSVFDGRYVVHRHASDGPNAVLPHTLEEADAMDIAISPGDDTQNIRAIVTGRQRLPCCFHDARSVRKGVRELLYVKDCLTV